MTKEEAIKEIINIKKRLLSILSKFENISLSNEQTTIIRNEVINLYHRYLKIYVQVGNNIPNFINEDKRFSNNNCYFYALDLGTPNIFIDITKRIIKKDKISNEIGTIAKLPILDNLTKENLLEYFYADLDALKIKAYDSSLNGVLNHNGYKISIFIDENPKYSYLDSDYHFIRQNKDGLWSEKYGYYLFPNVAEVSEESINHLRRKYEYVKTLELVKPSIKK